MSDTPNLKLPYMLAAQAQKHVTHNEALRMLDAVVQLSVLDRNLASPPGSPADGDRYIVAASPTGAWAGHAAHIAAYQDGAWLFYMAEEGWLAWIADENVLTVFDGAAWVLVSGGGTSDHGLLTGLGDDDHTQYHNNARGDARYTPIAPTTFGINATADTTNRLALASAASLFNHAGNGHQVKVNKNAAADTASFLFQTGFSGRAEFGTTGDDRLSFKISSDGTSWSTAFVCDPDQNVLLKGYDQRIPIGGYSGPAIAVHGTAASNSALGSVRWSNNAGGPSSLFAKSRGASPSVHAAVSSGDGLFQQVVFGSDGTSFAEGARFDMAVDGTVAAGSVPARITLSTTAAGGSSPAERVRITSGGNVGIGTTAPSTALHVNGAIRCASYTVAGVPSASTSGAGSQIYVSNESGGAVIAFSDGTNWRRVTDRAVIS